MLNFLRDAVNTLYSDALYAYEVALPDLGTSEASLILPNSETSMVITDTPLDEDPPPRAMATSSERYCSADQTAAPLGIAPYKPLEIQTSEFALSRISFLRDAQTSPSTAVESLVDPLVGPVTPAPPQYSPFRSPTNASIEQDSLGYLMDEAQAGNITPVTNTGNFSGARYFSIHHPTMIEAHHQHVHHHGASNTLADMIKHVIPGTEYDSSERDSPPQCHPGTRTDIIHNIRTRIHDNNLPVKIIWLYGAAGVGKSAIMQTLAEAESPHALCATLFFSRPNKRNDPKRVFTTLAYRFAVMDPSYRNYVWARMAADPSFLAKSIDEQFKQLFIVPFSDHHITANCKPWVILLDGLDECRGEADQCRIVELIGNSVLNHPAIPLIWIIASRPEAHLQAPFSRIRRCSTGFWEQEIPIDSDGASRDVERYLQSEFMKIQEEYPDLVSPSSRWPTDGQFLKLADAASGLFVFAATLIKYISDPVHGDPVSRLDHVLHLIDKPRHKRTNLGKNPFENLDLLYTQIMSDISPEVLPITKQMLGFYLLKQEVFGQDFLSSPTFLEACNILGLEQHVAYAALRRLRSVLAFPSPEGAGSVDDIRFLHASFSDFLRDPHRSHSYYIDLDKELTGIWWRYDTIIRQGRDFCTGAKLSWPPGKDSKSNDMLRRLIFRKSVNHWICIIHRNCYSACSSCAGVDKHRLLFGPSDLNKIHQGLDLTLFKARDIKEYLRWLKEHAPVAVQERMISQEFPLNMLDKERFFKALCAEKWIRHETPLMDSDCDVDLTSIKGLGSSQWAKAEEILWNKAGPLELIVKASEEVSADNFFVTMSADRFILTVWGVVTVLGTDPSNCIGVVNLWGEEDWGFRCWVFPYSVM